MSTTPYTEACRNEEDAALLEKVKSFGYLFDDMLFKKDSITFWSVEINQYDENGEKILTPLPARIANFQYETACVYRLWDLKNVNPSLAGTPGVFVQSEHTRPSLNISPEYFQDDHIIMHEMIHLHEYILDQVEPFYRDICFWSLYNELIDKVPDLDKIMHIMGHLFSIRIVDHTGGIHSLLFLLKSFDIDMRTGKEFGTTAGEYFVDFWQLEMKEHKIIK